MSPRQQALLDGAPRYASGRPCPRGHVGERYACNGKCVICSETPEEKAAAVARTRKWKQKMTPAELSAYEKAIREQPKVKANQKALNKAWRERQGPEWRQQEQERLRRYWAENPEAWRRKLEKDAQRAKEDLQYRLQRQLRSRLFKAVRNRAHSGSAVGDLGCTIAEFMVHIEKQFQPGMTWENWTYDTWHLDHIRPLASFDLTDRKQWLEACNYKNYQPLWAFDNLSKNKRMTSLARPGRRKET
jgi:hypothetical protein